MTGATITASFDDAAFRGALTRLQAATSDMRPLLKRIGVGMVDATQQHFRDATDPAGRAWTPLRPDYAAFKRGPGILRESAMRGGLMGSITYRLPGGDQVAWGSGKVYAAVHQFGAVIVPVRANALVFHIGKRVVRVKRVTIPARPYLGLGEHERRVAMDMVAFTLQEAIGAAP